jgi:hypothetical protein
MAEQNPEVTTRIPLDEVEKAAKEAAERAVYELLFGDRDAPQVEPPVPFRRASLPAR